MLSTIRFMVLDELIGIRPVDGRPRRKFLLQGFKFRPVWPVLFLKKC